MVVRPKWNSYLCGTCLTRSATVRTPRRLSNSARRGPTPGAYWTGVARVIAGGVLTAGSDIDGSLRGYAIARACGHGPKKSPADGRGLVGCGGSTVTHHAKWAKALLASAMRWVWSRTD